MSSRSVTIATYLGTSAVFLIATVVLALGVRYQASINMTESLPFHVALIEKGNFRVQRGDLLAFKWAGEGPLHEGLELVKRVAAISGDRVHIEPVEDKNFPPSWLGEMVAESPQGQELVRLRIKAFSRTGDPLQPGPTGVIPEQRYLVQGDHKDSLDSRYSLLGWVRADQVVGKVVWAW